MVPFVNGVLWYCNMRDGDDIDWGAEVFFTLAGPLTWIFVIMELFVIYSK
jgi:hypothetical protein